MDANFKREIILDHYEHPHHRGLFQDDTYIYTDTNNESCIDEIHLMVKLENDRICDAYFDGEACAICTSSTSIMLDTLIGKTTKEAREIIQHFKNMVDEKKYDDSSLEQALVFDDVSKQPSRKKCALLPWWGMEEALQKEKTN